MTFDIIFNRQPFLKNSEEQEDPHNLQYLREAIKLRAMTVGITDGVQTPLQISPASIYSNNKEYREDEFHVGVVFDVSEFSKSATEKLLHAQLSIRHTKLVDKDQAQFTLDHHLEMRGLPIYVFEETDMTQIVKEESDAVREAVEGE